MNKRAVIPRDVIISMILFSMFIVATAGIIGSIYPSYGASNVTMSATYNQADKITTDLQTMQNQVEASGASPVGFLEYISTGAWVALKLTTNSIGYFTAIVTDVGAEFGVPTIFVYGFIAIFTVVVIFGILSAIFRSKV